MLSNVVKELQAAKKEIAAKIQSLTAEAKNIDTALGALTGSAVSSTVPAPSKNTRTPAQKAAMAAAQKARWAKIKVAAAPAATPAKKKRTMSAAARKAISVAVKARWARQKAAKKK